MRKGALKQHAQAIREALAAGNTVAHVARTFGCDARSVRDIRDGVAYGTGPRQPRALPRGEVATPVPKPDTVSRAYSHWLKNRDSMTVGDVADMYGIDPSMIHARRRKEGT